MNQTSKEQNRLSIVVDKKHNTVYCVEPNGKSYIKRSTENYYKGERTKCCSSKA